jgi:tetratricopeptide (TPR) repeat protein
MTHKPKNAENTDTDIRNLPEKLHPRVFRKKSLLTDKTHNGHDHWKILQEAISEKDIIHFREQLKNVLSESNFKNKNQEAEFDLTDEINSSAFLEEWKDDNPDFLYAEKPLPKIHIHHHRRALAEHTHQFYIEQNKIQNAIRNDPEETENERDWQMMAEALKEKDIVELRESLHQISKFVSHHDLSTDEIEKYLNGEMSGTELNKFKSEMRMNPGLTSDVRLVAGIQEAISETDIIKLREKLIHVTQSQHSTSRSIREIETFLEGELKQPEKDSFLEEMTDNADLKAEVNLVKNLNKAFSENDVSGLRKMLHQISKHANQQSIYSVLPLPDKVKKVGRSGTYAAILIFLMGLSSVIWYVSNSRQNSYDKFFVTPEAVSSFRSVESNVLKDLNRGFEWYNQKEYGSALTCFSKVLQTDENNPVAHFYAGASSQSIHLYDQALYHYQCVISHRDNIFMEQAEWLKALCYLGVLKKESAVLQLEEIIQRKGFYKKDALSLLSELKEKGD